MLVAGSILTKEEASIVKTVITVYEIGLHFQHLRGI